ncbi:hypothetical protein RhiirA5_427252 [Rhizophagus irregularis]|uniref:Uncharacterized protein n=1 Tax=Rhizophagus irregularis TaxID=588596 RepID=A0A2I1F7Y5_9GLOM|nr:hypothetical protein RhiirA5_427252 [Rhizophagus irregularis]PKY30480.1 hypothetical protein RhiirB3_447590 [Rhizophagus irregularis]
MNEDTNWCFKDSLGTADFITNNIYTECPIINETKTTTVASYISTRVSYFCQKEHHINTMVQGFGLPQISYTMTIAEIYWLLIGDLAQLQHVNEQQIFPILKDISSRTLISIAGDYINCTQCMPKEYDKQFRHYTNLLSELIIREGAKVMFLTNKLFSEPVEELCNGSIGVITKLIFERKL